MKTQRSRSIELVIAVVVLSLMAEVAAVGMELRHLIL